jgi:hypothetical protein
MSIEYWGMDDYKLVARLLVAAALWVSNTDIPQKTIKGEKSKVVAYTLQRQNTEISKQIFPEKEYWGFSLNFYINASVSDIYIPTTSLPILLEEICRQILGLYKYLTET